MSRVRRLTAFGLVAAFVAVSCGSGSDEPGSPAPSVPALRGPVPISGEVVEIDVGGEPIGIAAGEGAIWVVNSEFASLENGSVSRIDPLTNEVVATVEVGRVPLETAVGDGAVWVSNSADDTVSKIDPSTNEVVATIDTCAAPEGLAIGDGAVWVACEDDDAVGRIDPTRNEMTERIDVGSESRFVTFAFESLWVSNYADSTIARIDSATGEVIAEVATAQGPQIMVEAAGSLWVSCTDADLVQQIDPSANGVVGETPTSFAPDGLAFDGSYILWVATEAGPRLAAIETAFGPGHRSDVLGVWEVAQERAINANQVMVYEGGSLWLPILGRGVVLRIPPQVTIVE